MRKFLRRAVLGTLKTCGAFSFARESDWRRQRLLILCYHGISLEDEHQWRPALYISPQKLERRLEILRRGNYAVLPLGDLLERLYRNDLPPRAVALTFDDGAYDFYKQAYPRLKQFGFPATVYLTTYYSEFQRPIFNLICSYMMWKARDIGTADFTEFGSTEAGLLNSSQSPQNALEKLPRWVETQNLTRYAYSQIAPHLSHIPAATHPKP